MRVHSRCEFLDHVTPHLETYRNHRSVAAFNGLGEGMESKVAINRSTLLGVGETESNCARYWRVMPCALTHQRKSLPAMTHLDRRSLLRWIHEYSIPLILGVAAALALANACPETYERIVHAPLPELVGIYLGQDHGAVHDSHHGLGHYFSLHFLINDIYMVLFFGVAAKEISEACLKGGALNPISKAINPLCGTVGGVLGPVTVYLLLNALMGQPSWSVGWGIPTATDIALAWLVARLLFGKGHPAICFLLLLAVADDAIGLGIIAIAYPDPLQPTEWLNAWWILPGMGTAYLLRIFGIRSWLPYLLFGGVFSWWGLFSAHLHPALALVFIVPFIPGCADELGWPRLVAFRRKRKIQLFTNHREHDRLSALEHFEHDTRSIVDGGLFLFALANAGVSFGGVSNLSWIVFLSLVVGKTLGVTLFSHIADRVGFHLPKGMDLRHLLVTGVISGLGLTVALFVSGQAFADPLTQGAAKMGALWSIGAAMIAAVLAITLRVASGLSFAIPWPAFRRSTPSFAATRIIKE